MSIFLFSCYSAERAHADRGSVYLDRDFSPRMIVRSEQQQNILYGTFERSEVLFSLISYIFPTLFDDACKMEDKYRR